MSTIKSKFVGPAAKKGFKQPREECEFCHLTFSRGNIAKHKTKCSGNGAQNSLNCKSCGNIFVAYGKPSSMSMACRNVWLSKKAKDMYATGCRTPIGYTKRSQIYTSKTNGSIKVMSSYEYDACLIFDDWLEAGKISKWEYTKDKFTYIDVDKIQRTYFPDFKIYTDEDNFYYIETKGFKTLNDECKWKAIRDLGLRIEIWFGDDINQHKSNKD